MLILFDETKLKRLVDVLERLTNSPCLRIVLVSGRQGSKAGGPTVGLVVYQLVVVILLFNLTS